MEGLSRDEIKYIERIMPQLNLTEKEEAAFRTYVHLVANVHDEESREVLLALAEEEVKHKLRFETEYNELFKKT